MHEWDKYGNPVKFNIAVREYNRQNKMGGRLRRYRKASLLMLPKKNRLSEIERLKHKRKVVAEKKPNHFLNRTRNIKLATGEIKKINILLITEFNGQKVVY